MVKIDFQGMSKPESLESHNQDEVAKMQECIAHIESGEGERAIPILKGLISGEAQETEENKKEEVAEAPKKSFRDKIAEKI